MTPSRKCPKVRSINLLNLAESVTLEDLDRAIQSRQTDKAWSLFTNIITQQQHKAAAATIRQPSPILSLTACSKLYALLNFAKELSYKSTKIRHLRQQQMEQLVDYVIRHYPHCSSKEQFFALVDEIPIMRYKVILKQIRRGNPVAAWTKFIRFHFQNLRKQTVPTANMDSNKLPRNACLELMSLVLKLKNVTNKEKRRRLRVIALYGAGTSGFDSRYLSSSHLFRLAYMFNEYRENDLLTAHQIIDRFVMLLSTEENEKKRADALDELIWRIIQCNDMKKATEVLTFAQQNLNVEINEMIFVNLMDGFLRQRKPTEALSVFEQLLNTRQNPTVRAFNSILNLFTKQGWRHRSEQVFRSMLKWGVKPDAATFTEMIRINARDNNYKACEQYYYEMLQREIQPNVYTYSALIEASSRSQSIKSVFKWLDTMMLNQVQLNEVIISNILTAISNLLPHSNVRNSKYSNYQLQQQQQQQHPDHYHHLLNTICQIAHQASLYGIKVDTVLYTILLQLQSQFSGIKGSLEIHQSMIDNLVAPNAHTYTTLITICGKKHMPEVAQQIFKLMQRCKNEECKPNTITYSALIDVWQTVGKPHKVTELITDFLVRCKSDKSGRFWIDERLRQRIKKQYC
ncbi:hypothetical protein BDF20DRAFT_902276 [Mycotypha africana]|uniref:uncharacterized protein n=1 Tax=Mycotypha africana TaxID=64632 RepID=UPI0023013739|nr:uncharacterized protein BDF20DRAFT_902276 [Mycotypha africana]KAI8967198.1 hypothetical protein BDF20DRAFT_902276 [Mycotypha africana]